MLFASIDLARRIERAECQLLRDCVDAIRRRRPETAVLVAGIVGGVAVWAGNDSPMNKVAGLGFAGPLDVADLEAFEGETFRRGSGVRVELSSLGEPSIAPLLSRRGYVLDGFEDVLGRSLEEIAGRELPVGVEVEPSGLDELGMWLDVVVDGFATPDEQGVPSSESYPREAIERAIGDMAEARGFTRYLARLDDVVAGGASLRVFDGVAQLCGAATLPVHRRRGIQTAMLDRRLADAREQGCDVAVVTTQPGSKSQQNVKRLGFELLYTRVVLVREPERL